ncbi:DUF418 domain-containing protein [Candidatus Palauibacter sp.]|uniref:DUF418 domain-containing protein n=1 Tax=Candidatus Palauibacter sp. TaxID=3101350 RepID=UPI003B0173C2
MSSPSAAGPGPAATRIASLDVLRGFAVLGILIVNIQGFARVFSAYMNPHSAGGFEGAEVWLWSLVHLFAETKFISIFSMLFGAGMAMMSDRMAARGAAGTGLHYRRQFWLLVIGLAHAYLIWHGDILVAYALCGFILYPLRNLPPRRLLWIGGCAVAFLVPLWGLAGISVPYWPAEDLAASVADWSPPPEAQAAETAGFRGTWTEQMRFRATAALTVQTTGFLSVLLWRAGGLMLAGMALYRLGVLSASRSAAFYRRMAVIGLATGLPLAAAGVAYKLHHEFAFEKAMFQGELFNYAGSVGVFLGYVGLVMLAVRRGWLSGLQRRLAATGRMALTNYIAQSVICSLIFYGHGLGMFERVGVPGRLGIVVGIWALQLLWSPWWLARFRFGPLEWLWRSLSYMKRQPLRL